MSFGWPSVCFLSCGTHV
uniref:Uncharacterized protein n=1 Tax=Anguilla anguilla TaxID=7936 RepID=A0A0E9PJA6_ANGAN